MKLNFFLALILFTSLPTLGQVDPIDKNGLAIGGYDVVAYLETGKAVKGSSQIATNWNNATYHFSSIGHLELFQSDPEKFLPQYDGYCALAVSYGKKISINPEAFKIANGKLYLFFHGKSGGRQINSLETWNKNEARLLKKADELWPDVKNKEFQTGSTL